MRTSFHRSSAGSARFAAGAAGFSILEMLVVVAIIGFVAVVGVPSLLNQLSKLRLESTANDVANLLRQTRLRAIRDNVQYTVEVDGTEVDGMGLQGNIEWVVPPPPGEPFWQGNGVIEMQFTDPRVRVYDDSGAAQCQEGATWGGTSITYGGTGTAIDTGGGGTPGTGAICVWDDRGNVLQVLLEFPSGQPKVRKFMLAADSPSGSAGFFEKTNVMTGNSAWVWY